MRKLTGLMFTLCAVWLVAAPSVSGQFLPNANNINKSVVFIYSAAPNGSVDESRPVGTGFFVQVPLKSLPDKSYYLLVTARHVVQPAWAYCPPQVNPSVVYLRLNKKQFAQGQGSGVEFLRVDLTSDLLTGPENVDVALMTLSGSGFTPDKYDVDGVPIYYFGTKEQLEALSFADEVASAGLLPAFPGSVRNYPIFKFGHISTKPDEPVQTRCAPNEPARFLRLIFVAMNLVPGNSGSPLFFTPAPFTARKPHFIGLLSMSYLGEGVGGVTSAQEVYALIEQLKLPDANLNRGESPTQPAAKPVS
ncbi:MAG TPA: hypothetical protein VNY24_02525 [Candidatus Acidoferrales bacterium]|nr:hypothetical protein [Candidatus Acidoferrales bacterium]